jgi:hypothetical protein
MIKQQQQTSTFMKVPLLVSALAAAIAPMSQAALVSVNQNIHTFLTSPNNSSGLTRDVLFNDGAGNTVTLRFTVTTASGESFKSLDGASRVGVGTSGDGNIFDNTEDVAFAVKYFSHTGTVDLSSIAFRFDSIGFRKITNSLTYNLYWTVNGGSTLTQASRANENDYALDTSFTTIGSGAGNYSGVFENQSNGVNDAGQLSKNTPTTGLRFSVQFVPEPSSALLGSLGVLALLRRRRQ